MILRTYKSSQTIFIGILAAFAIPAFDGFRKKARSSEAKTNLGALFTAQKAFFYEHSTYCAHLADVGFSVTGADTYYTIGFGANSGGSNSGCTAGTAPDWKSDGSKATAQAPEAACDADTTDFTAGAVGPKDGTDLIDVDSNYRMDQTKKLNSNSIFDKAGC